MASAFTSRSISDIGILIVRPMWMTAILPSAIFRSIVLRLKDRKRAASDTLMYSDLTVAITLPVNMTRYDNQPHYAT